MDRESYSALVTRGLVVFAAGGEWLAAPVEEVAGMMDADHLAPIPGRGSPMAGVVAFRGGVVPALDLPAALGAEESAPAQRYAIVLERGTDRFALLVSGMPRLVPARDLVLREHADPDADPAEPGAAGTARGDEPVVLATYEVAGRDVRYLDYWSLMDTVAPPAAFRLGGLGGR
ncbi:MAG TPA: chemotaxis protein CheW [Candidatus Eisenbacteria bacterium]|nr:chemotaxis protein CheW [Candidatus Eisenbacteria bacterium]